MDTYNMPLKYLGVNEHGAHMYHDPLKRTVMHIDDHEIKFDFKVHVQISRG